MSASPDDAFYSAPDSPPSNHSLSQSTERSLSTPPNPNPNSDTTNAQRFMSSPTKWLSRMASSAGRVISSVLGLSDECSTDDESDGDVVEMPSTYEEQYESNEKIKKLNQIPSSQGQALLEIHNVTLAKANKFVEKKSPSSFKLPLKPNTSPPLPPDRIQQLSPSEANLPLNSNTDHCVYLGKNHQQPPSDIIQPVNPLPSPPTVQNQQQPFSDIIQPVNRMPSHPTGHSGQQPLPNIIPPVNPLPSPPPCQNQQPPCPNIIPPANPLPSSASLSKNQQQSSNSLTLPNPNVVLSSINQKQTSSSHICRSKPHSRDQPGLKCPLPFNRKEAHKKLNPDLILDPMVEEGSAAKMLAGNLKEVIELLSGNFDAKQFVDMDLLDALEMKGIKFEDPPWWPK